MKYKKKKVMAMERKLINTKFVYIKHGFSIE